MNEETLHRITRDGAALAALHRPGREPTIVFLPGLRSDMTGDKASALARHGGEAGFATLRLDYSGHGASGGAFTDGSIARWRDDALAVINALVPGRILLVGSSMGGWIGLLAAMSLGKRVAGFIGIAAAPDFTRAIAANLSADQRAALEREETILLPAEPDPLPLTRRFLEESGRCCLLDAPIPLHCPVRLLQGQNDDVVPWKTALAISNAIEGEDCQTILVKDGDHRLSRPADIALLLNNVDRIIADDRDR